MAACLETLQYLYIPTDPEDFRFTHSFTVDQAESDEVADFFDSFGFVVFRDAISSTNCEDVLDDFWTLLEEKNSSLRRDDISTWNQGLSHFGMPKGSTSLFRPSLLRLRQDKSIYQCFASIIGTENLIVSHDRWLLHRPTKDVGMMGVDKPEWETRRNIHLDMNPWEFMEDESKSTIMKRLENLNYGNRRSFTSELNDVHKSMGRSVQGILNLKDIIDSTNGGTIIIPGSHKTFENWIKGRSVDEKQKTTGPMQYRVSNEELQSLAQHITLRAGSLLLFDRRCFHGSTPNKSSSCRAAVPITFFDECVLMDNPKRARDRTACIRKEIEGANFMQEITDIGRRVFGLNNP